VAAGGHTGGGLPLVWPSLGAVEADAVVDVMVGVTGDELSRYHLGLHAQVVKGNRKFAGLQVALEQLGVRPVALPFLGTHVGRPRQPVTVDHLTSGVDTST
jgi:hypothetical protein